MKKRSVLLVAAFAVAGMLVLAGCPKQPEETMPEQPAMTAPAEQQAPTEAVQPAEQPEERAPSAAEALKPVYFDFDRSLIRDDARGVLKANAAWLKANPSVKIRIEGNCDERGTIEYNQALGQRRAAAAKKYLTDLGVSGSRISLISYGKEKPTCSQSTEDCWQENRRDDFVEQ